MPTERLGDIVGLHKKLATRYKQFETTDGQTPPVVVLNEMRYALRAIVKLLNQASFTHLDEDEKEAFNIACQEAHHALRNAYHDLVDGILIQISRIMDNLLDKYPVATANVLGDRRLSILTDLNEVENHIAESRGDGMKRQKLYDIEIYDKWFVTIIEHYQFIDQVALLQIITEDDRLNRESRKFWLTIVLSILGIIVAVAALAVAL